MSADRQRTLRRLFRYSRPYRGRLLWALAGMVVYAAGAAGLAALIKPIFDSVLPLQENVGVIARGIVAVFFLKGIGSFASSYLMADVGQRVVMDLRNALYRHILDQSASFFAHGQTGRLLSRINNDVGQVQQAVSETAGDLARETLALVGYAGLLFWYDARLTIVCLTGAPLIVYPLVRLGQRVRRTTRRSQEALEQISHLSAEAFTGHRIVKAFGTEKLEAEKFNRAGYHLYRTNMKVTAALSSLPPLMELLGGVGMAAAVVYGSSQIAEGHLSPGDFVTFIGTLLLMYGPAKKLSRVNADLQQATAASERIFEMLDTHTEVLEQPGAAPLAPFQHAIEFRDVSFRYDDAASADPEQRVADRPRRTDDRDRWTQRRRQDLAGQPAATLLRRRLGRHPDRRRGYPSRDAGVTAARDRHRDAGYGSVRRLDRRQHRLRVAAGVAGADRGRRARRQRA